MKLTVYDKSNSHPALTYKGKRIITVCRDGSMYLSRILSRELSLHAGNRLCIARDEDRPKDWYMFVSDDENGFTIWNDPRCARFSNSFIAGMILDAAKVEKSAGFMVAKEPVNVDGRLCYRIILDNPIPKGSSSGFRACGHTRPACPLPRSSRIRACGLLFWEPAGMCCGTLPVTACVACR